MMRRTNKGSRPIRSPRQRALAVQALERRLTLNVDVDWNGKDLTITCHGPNDSVYVTVGDNGVQVQSQAAVVPYWVGGPHGCYPGTVQSIKVIGSPFKDTIDLTQVPGIFVWNEALYAGGQITVDCKATAPNQFVGDTIKLGGLGEKADGSPYADTIECGPNGDTVNGGGGADTITGGAGNDSLTLGGLGPNGEPTMGPGFGNVKAKIEGGAGNDTIAGGNMQSKLYGQDGNDTITAGPWGDFIDGGDGSDTLRGGAGPDTIHGGSGDDDIDAMSGNGNENFPESGNNYVTSNGVPVFDAGNRNNDYGIAEGNHTNVGGIHFGANNNGTNDDGNAWVAAGDTFSVLATKLSIPEPDPGVNGQPGETIASVTYYLDDHGFFIDPQTGKVVTTQGADQALEQWDCDKRLGSAAPGEAVSVKTGKNGNDPAWEPGTYRIYAIALASNGFEGCPWWRDITVVGPKVGINAVVPQAEELLAGQPGVFDVTRDGPTDSALTVNYMMSGTATNGTDYSTLSGTVTIPAGSADATIDVNPLDDGDGDDSLASESVIATLTSTSDYDVDPSASSATVNIAEEDPPTVSVSADIPTAVENDTSQDGEYTISRTGPTDSSLTVNLAASGTAVAGTNYVALPSSVTIPAGSQTAVLQVAALEDTPGSNDPETVTETIQPGSNYTIGSPSSADVSILEQPTSTVTIAATTPTTAEDSSTPGEFTVTRTAPYDSALTVAYSLSGTAVNGVDYQTLSGTITIPAAAPSVVLDVDPLDDGGDAGEPASSIVTATISPDPNQSYLVGAANSDSVTIAEEAPPPVSIAAQTPKISENGSSGTFTVSRSDPEDEPLTVYFALSGNALPGTDFTDPGASVTIPAHSYTATITIAPLDDGDGDDSQVSESLTATLSASSMYQIINGGSATMNINEEPFPQVTVAWQSDAVENPASSGSFLVTRSGSTDNPLTVSFNMGGTAIAGTDYTSVGTTLTIPAGQSSAPITIAPIDDQQDEPSETVTVAIVN
ncbi:MAG: Calx-beta domain-containing protein, partial [Pirellulales bacterium]